MYRYTLYIIALLSFSACVKQQPIEIRLEKTNVQADFTGEVISVGVRVDRGEWSARSNAQWCVVEESGADTLRLKVEANRGKESRRCMVDVLNSDGRTSLLVLQASSPGGDYMRWSDSMALVETWRLLDGENWEWRVENKPVEGWDFRMPINTWRGVVVSTVDGSMRVLSLDISDVGLKGQLPEAVGRLSELNAFYAACGDLEGDPVAVLSTLEKLEILDLSYTDISLEGQWDQMQYLVYLSLSGVNFGNKNLPVGFAKLNRLQWLYLDGCRINGTFPEQIRSLITLRELAISDNQIYGELPRWIGEIEDLEYLDFSLCQLDGTLPDEMRLLTKLRTLKGASNRFSGDLPEVFSAMKSLQVLNFANCAFEKLPISVMSCDDLRYLNLSFNNIQGTLPLELLNLLRLEWFIVVGNRMSGSIDPSLKSSQRWSAWKPGSLICPQQEGYGFTNCD